MTLNLAILFDTLKNEENAREADRIPQGQTASYLKPLLEKAGQYTRIS